MRPLALPSAHGSQLCFGAALGNQTARQNPCPEPQAIWERIFVFLIDEP